MKVLIACEYSGRVRDAFCALGHDAWSCDLLPTESEGNHIQADVLNVLDWGWDLMIAHPPCTRLANSGVRWLSVPPKGKTLDDMQRELLEAVEFYKALRNAPIPKKCIENPVMHKHAKALIELGERQVVQPWWFGDQTFKATGYELIGLPKLVETNRLEPPQKGTPEHKAWSWIHLAPPSKDRWKIRSRTPFGIAKAMAEQWGGVAEMEKAA